MNRDAVRAPRLLQAILLVAFAAKLAVVVAALNRGFELGDEGFFLLNLKHPEAAPPPLEGYRLLGRLCGGSCDVGVVGARLYRVAAELAGSVALIAGVFAWARVRVFAPGAVALPAFLAWCLLGTLLSVESRSLGYNDVTNLLCFSAVGALFALASLPVEFARRRVLLAFAVGALLGLQLPVKWPPAVVLAVLASLVLAGAVRSRTGRERLLLLTSTAAGMAAAAALAVMALGGVEAVRSRLRVASELIALTAHEPLELLERYVVLDKFTWLHTAVFIAYLGVTFHVARARDPESRDRTLAAGLGGAAAVLLAGVLTLHPTFLHWSALHLGCVVIGLPVVLIALASRAPRAIGSEAPGDDRIPLLLLLFVLPFVVIVGTNVTMTMRIPTHGLPLYVLVAVLVLDLAGRTGAWRSRSAVAALLVVVTSGVFVRHHVLHPYGLAQPIYEQRFEVANLPGVRVDAQTRDFLTKLALEMKELGYRPGDPVIAFDYMPGLVYYLGGTSPRYNFYMFRSPSYNCYNADRAGLASPPFLILAKPLDSLQLDCLKAFRFPYDFGLPRELSFPYERVYAGFSAPGFSKIYLYAPRDPGERLDR